MNRSVDLWKNGQLAVALLAFVGCMSATNSTGAPPAPTKKMEVVNKFPHNSDSFTQGLVIHDGILYEGTGQLGRSSLKQVSLEDGKDLIPPITLDASYFGEGITICDGKIYQLTWKNGFCLIYDLKTLAFTGHFTYTFEGWGITSDGKDLIASDGTQQLRFIDPTTFEEKRTIQVTDRGKPIRYLNELEWVEGEIWANVWYEDRIARISPETGAVTGWLDLRHIYPQSKRPKESVLNGIAYDSQSKRCFVTGKNWPHLYEVRVAK